MRGQVEEAQQQAEETQQQVENAIQQLRDALVDFGDRLWAVSALLAIGILIALAVGLRRPRERILHGISEYGARLSQLNPLGNPGGIKRGIAFSGFTSEGKPWRVRFAGRRFARQEMGPCDRLRCGTGRLGNSRRARFATACADPVGRGRFRDRRSEFCWRNGIERANSGAVSSGADLCG